MKNILIIARQNILLYLNDLAPLIVFIFMPLLLMAFFAPLNKAILVNEGFVQATGGELAIPGMTLMFSMMLIGTVGVHFYREHGWHTWERLRIVTKSHQIVIGKLIPALIVLILQALVVFILGSLLIGLRVEGSMFALILILLCFILVCLSLTMFFIAYCKSLDQVIVLSNLVAILLPGLGGGIAPVSTLPIWAQVCAQASPVYWAIEGLKSVILKKAGLGDVWLNIVVLIGFATILMLLSLLRFRVSEVKRSDT